MGFQPWEVGVPQEWARWLWESVWRDEMMVQAGLSGSTGQFRKQVRKMLLRQKAQSGQAEEET